VNVVLAAILLAGVFYAGRWILGWIWNDGWVNGRREERRIWLGMLHDAGITVTTEEELQAKRAAAGLTDDWKE
jgi:hypothetical protein